MSGKEKLVGLDYMRILMMLMVFCFHAWVHTGADFGIMSYFFNAGAIAMEGFFMLSGFVLVYQHGQIRVDEELKNFYFKRFFSLFPLYIIIVMIRKGLYGRFISLQGLAVLPFEILGWTSSFDGSFEDVVGDWFVSCMFFCYFLYPLLWQVLSFVNKKIWLVVLYLLSAMAPITAGLCGYSSVYPNPFYRMLQFSIGMILAMELFKRSNPFEKYSQGLLRIGVVFSVVIFILSISFLGYKGWGSYTSYDAITIPCWGILLILLSGLKNDNWLCMTVVRRLSKISYAFFLSQAFCFFIGRWLVDRIGYDGNYRGLLTIFLCFLICLASSIILTAVDHIVQGYMKRLLTRR